MTKNAKKAAATTAVALLTAASVVTGSQFETPAALLPEDGAPAIVYNANTGLDGAEDDDAGVSEDESEETRRRGGIRAMLRQRILRLPLVVRLLVVLPLWALGTVILAAAGAVWPLLSPVLGKVAGFALLLGLLIGAFVLAATAAFPALSAKKLLSRRNLVALLLGAAALSVVDAVLGAAWPLLSPALGRVAGFALMLALLVGACVLAAKAAFPDLPIKKLLNRRSLVALLLGAAALSVVDAVLGAAWADYGQAKNIVLSAGFFLALCCASVPFALREQKRRLAAAKASAERAKKPDRLVFTDAGGTFTVQVPNVGG